MTEWHLLMRRRSDSVSSSESTLAVCLMGRPTFLRGRSVVSAHPPPGRKSLSAAPPSLASQSRSAAQSGSAQSGSAAEVACALALYAKKSKCGRHIQNPAFSVW